MDGVEPRNDAMIRGFIAVWCECFDLGPARAAFATEESSA